MMDRHQDQEPLGPGLRAFGESLTEAARERSASKSRWKRMARRPIILGGVFSVLVAAGAGAAALISIGEPAPERSDAPPGMQQTGGRTLAVTARDPDGKLDWGAAVYTQNDGKKCVIAGRLYRGQIGELHGNKFHAFTPSDHGACGRPEDHSTRMFVASGAARGESDRGLVFGRVAEDVRELRVKTPDGDRLVRLGTGGAFLLVFDGEVDLDEVKLSVEPAS